MFECGAACWVVDGNICRLSGVAGRAAKPGDLLQHHQPHGVSNVLARHMHDPQAPQGVHAAQE